MTAWGHPRRFGHARGMSAYPATPAASLHHGNDAMHHAPQQNPSAEDPIDPCTPLK